jgi:Mor family transcriptional regulator
MVSINSSISFSSTYSYLSQVSAASISRASFAAISDGFALAGGGISFADIFANLPPAPMPRPPQYSVGLPDAAFKLNEFAQSIGQYGSAGAFGYEQYLGISAMSTTVNSFLSTQSLYAQSSVSNLHIGIDATFSSPAVLARETKDEFGTGLGAGEGHDSNLANSPEVVLALNNILKNNQDNASIEDVQKKLKDEYGIEAKIEDINGRKALKFANGDTFVDSSGNGMMGQADYKFGGAVDAIKKKYGLSDEDIKAFESDDGKKMLGEMNSARTQLQMPQEYKFSFGMDITSVQNSWFGVQNNFLDTRMFDQFFAKAYYLAY